MDNFLGVIPEAAYTETNPMRKMVKEILGGRTEPYSREEIECLVDQRYFGYESLIPLKKHEKSLLRREMVDRLLYRFNKGTTRTFVGSVCYQNINRNGSLPHIYHEEALKKESDLSCMRIMTKEEKLVFLEDPNNLDASWHDDWSVMSFAAMGYRSINEYSIRYAKSFTKAISKLQAVKGNKELHVLDLGGGVGQALSDIKKMHPELVTYNATRDEEFAHHPTNFHVIGFMERMPRALQGKIDFIFSNMTTRYLAFTDLVVQCCVLMLAEGGIMDVFFSSERSNNESQKDVELRMKKVYDFLKDQEQSGIVELKINHCYSSNIGGSFRSASGTLYPAARVFIKKLKV